MSEPFNATRRSLLTHGGRAVALALVNSYGLESSVRAAEAIKLRDLYNKDLSFSEQAVQMDGERVELTGYMAPPLKANASFFVLTRRPMSTCPFCDTETDWPDDIALVYTRRPFDVIAFNLPVVAEGQLSLGTERDEETGFVSRLRLVEASVSRY